MTCHAYARIAIMNEIVAGKNLCLPPVVDLQRMHIVTVRDRMEALERKVAAAQRQPFTERRDLYPIYRFRPQETKSTAWIP